MTRSYTCLIPVIVTNSHRKYLFGLKFLITADCGEVKAGTDILIPIVKSMEVKTWLLASLPSAVFVLSDTLGSKPKKWYFPQ